MIWEEEGNCYVFFLFVLLLLFRFGGGTGFLGMGVVVGGGFRTQWMPHWCAV